LIDSTVLMTEVRSRLLEGWQHSQLSGSRYTFDVDVEHCPNYGGALKIIATIDDPPVIVKILSHLGLPTRGPPRAPARRVDLFQTI
jgi:hypothetical protein